MDTINFCYFAYNFNYDHLLEIFHLLGMSEHHKEAFENAPGDNGTSKFFNWFMSLSRDNQKKVVEYVKENYKGVSE